MPAVNMELPQLLTTDTVGADTIEFMERLLHCLMDWYIHSLFV